MTISIIIPVYNVVEYLRQCLSSIIPQLSEDCELILIDDGSNDGSGRICDEYGTCPYVSVAHKKNGGQSSARNIGLEIAKGDYIVFVDSDDYILGDGIERLKLQLVAHPCDVMAVYVHSTYNKSGLKLIQNRMIPEGYYTGSSFISRCIKSNCILNFGPVYYVISRKYIANFQFKFYEGVIYEDNLWVSEVLLNSYKVYNSHLSYYCYNQREGSTTNSTTNFHKRAYSLNIVAEEQLKCAEIAQDRAAMKWFRELATENFFRGYWYRTEDDLEDFPNQSKLTLLRNAHRFKTKIKAILYCLSPRLAWRIGNYSKR